MKWYEWFMLVKAMLVWPAFPCWQMTYVPCEFDIERTRYKQPDCAHGNRSAGGGLECDVI